MPQLSAVIYTQVNPAVGCTRLLNATGHIGCTGPAAPLSRAPLLALSSASADVPGERVVIIPNSQMDAFLQRVLRDAVLQSRVKGLLVHQDAPSQASPSEAFPRSAFAPYRAPGYAWNPGGNGLSYQSFDFPIFLMDNDTSQAAYTRAVINADQVFLGALHWGELDSSMLAQHNASACLAAQHCYPLGGHSVWAALPPLQQAQPAAASQPVIMVVAQMDTTAFFHDAAVGADQPLSGLIAMLAAAEILGNSTAAAGYSRQLVFAAVNGEPWGYMGSKRFLWELSRGERSTAGLSLNRIEQVVELGQLGRSIDASGRSSLFVHSQQGPGFGDSTSLLQAVVSSAASTTEAQVTASAAASTNPGIPPSSLMSFLRVNASISGAVLAEFDSAFTNAHFEGHDDDESNLNAASVATAAMVAARALHTLAQAGGTSTVLQVDAVKVRSTVDSLIACLVKADPGLTCPLSLSLILPTRVQAEHYISDMHSLTADSQDPNPNIKSNIERFVWNFLALRTSSGPAKNADGSADGCDPYEHACEAGAVCLAYHPDRKRSPDNGRCIRSTACYVPSYSTRLNCSGCNGEDTLAEFLWQFTDAAADWEAQYGWPADPVWTESLWARVALRMYQRDTDSVARALVGIGLGVTGLSIVAVLAARGVYEKHLKSQ
ncbi:hypothetical protein WJX72_006597 [[Myrmecia] bisecta]|uniref:Nicastrin n=1 Tax=[Myrmecia] bisecta TaxID=41462 RepID=A0AAW1QR65_9CHLO